jgi:hypothetical protein
VVVAAGPSILPSAPAVPQARFCKLSFAVELRPKGSAYAATGDLRGVGALIRACGHSATVATSGIDFTPIHQLHESATIWFYAGGNLYKMVGCQGRYEVVFNAGEQVFLRFEMSGMVLSDPAIAAFPSITYMTNPAPGVVNAALAVGAWSPDFESVVMNWGQEVVERPNGNLAQGLRFRIKRHRPRLLLKSESILLSTYDPYADRKTPTARTITITVPGSGAGFRVKLTGVTGYVGDADHPDLTGFTGWDLNYLVTAGTFRVD